MTLCTKLVSLRKQKRFTQLDLAARLNVSRQAVSRWESGLAVPSTDNLKVLSTLYGVSLDYLLNDDADDPYKDVEEQEQEQEPNEQVQEAKAQSVKDKSKKRIIIYICMLILAISIAVIVHISKTAESEQQQIIPLEEMDTAIEDDYPEGTFSID